MIVGAFSGSEGRGDVWLDGEPNGRSEIGDEDKDEDSEDGSDGSDDSVGVGMADDGVMVDERSRALTNCPRYLGCVSQCLELEGASLSYI